MVTREQHERRAGPKGSTLAAAPGRLRLGWGPQPGPGSEGGLQAEGMPHRGQPGRGHVGENHTCPKIGPAESPGHKRLLEPGPRGPRAAGPS